MQTSPQDVLRTSFWPLSILSKYKSYMFLYICWILIGKNEQEMHFIKYTQNWRPEDIMRMSDNKSQFRTFKVSSEWYNYEDNNFLLFWAYVN